MTRAYFEYPKFVKKMKEGDKLARVLGAARHPFFYKHYNDGCSIHPKQAQALAKLGTFMRENSGKFTSPSDGFSEKRLAAFATAEEISKNPNRTIKTKKLGLEADLRGIAAARGLSCAMYFNHCISDVRISGSYQGIINAFISASGAKKGDTLVAGDIGTSRMLFTLEIAGKRRDCFCLGLVSLCAEALGGSVASAGSYSMDMTLPVRAKKGNKDARIG